MRVSKVWTLTLYAACVSAFRDTSPFFAFSTSKLPHLFEYTKYTPNVASGPALSSSLHKDLKNCPSDAYIFVNQAEAALPDFEIKDATPELRRKLSNADRSINSAHLVPDVTNGFDVESLKSVVAKECRASVVEVGASQGLISTSDSYPQLIVVDFPELPLAQEQRTQKLFEHDSFLNNIISRLNAHTYTVVFTTTPPPEDVQRESSGQAHPQRLFDYDSEDNFPNALHTDLKRDTTGHLRRQASNDTDDRALFERYNYLNEAIYMGLVGALIFISVVYIGISAVSSIEVSYLAFSKEMGPAAQKKQQQNQ